MKTILTFLLIACIFHTATAQIVSHNSDQNLIESNANGIGTLSQYKNTAKTNSVLESGKWIKVSAEKKGVVKLTYDKLKQMGINSPENIAVYTNGGFMLPKMNNVEYPDDLQKIPVLHAKDETNKDAIFFYCTGTTNWEYNESHNNFTHILNLYSNKTYFFLTSDIEKSPSPESTPDVTGDATVSITNFNDYQLYEEEVFNLEHSGRRWFSDRILQSATKTYTFNFENINKDKPANITIAAAAKSSTQSKYLVNVGNNLLGEMLFYKSSFIGDIENEFTTPIENELKISINYENSSSNGDSWVDFISINATSKLIFSKNQFTFRSIETLNNPVLDYNIETTIKTPVIWEITDFLSPSNIAYSITPNGITFRGKGQSIKEYVIFNPVKGAFEEPQLIGNVINQNIHGTPAYDMIIITHPDFVSAAEDLAEFHRKNDNLKILISSTEEIYNEFSSGLPDPAGIRNMLRHFYHKSSSTDSLRYVLLIGDGSYNNRNFDNKTANFIPTWQSEESLDETSTFQSDDFYVLLDDNEGEDKGDLDAGIGRFPCKTIEEADLIVNKVVNYASPKAMGNWRNAITFIADDEDNNNYPEESEALIDTINKYYPGFYTDKIYFDSYQQISTSEGEKYPDVTDAINLRMNEGALIFNYIGHANPLTMSHENVLGINDIKSWSNKNALPIFVTATCEISRFDGDNVSMGEEILLNPAGGGIALFTTTRVVYGSENFNLSTNFYRNAFRQDSNGENLRMGDIMRLAKNSTSGTLNLRKFSLLGDPALQLAFPKYKVITQSINGIDTNEDITIGALEKVTIKSYLSDNTGNIRSDIEGAVTVTIYDKTITVKTLANDGGDKFEYPIQNNIIYKGNSTVKNGEFEFSFIVPKDISYNIGKGKIFYYFSNDSIDGNGATDDFNIGGTSKNPTIDNTPPEIELFLNNEKFKSLDKVSSSALLLVNLADESGINTVGSGIGHDITATLDNDHSNKMILNDFYVSEADNYQRGKILFPLNNLEPGEHHLKITVWDVQNNSSEKEISFFVEEGFKIISLNNYPNPVEFYTNFNIIHNLPGDILHVKVDIFNLLGYQIDELIEDVSSYGTTETKIRWDVSSLKNSTNNGQILIYRITMQNLEGLIATGTGKLILKHEN